MAEALAEPINNLLLAADAWPETLEVKAAHEALDAFPRLEVWDAVQAELVRSRIFPAVGCENCRATHGLHEAREGDALTLPDRLVTAYRAACQREEAPPNALR